MNGRGTHPPSGLFLRNSNLLCDRRKSTHFPERTALSGEAFVHEIRIATFEARNSSNPGRPD